MFYEKMGTHYEGLLRYLGWNRPWIILTEKDEDENDVIHLEEIVFSTLKSLEGKLISFEVENEYFSLQLSEKSIFNAWQLIEVKGKQILLENTSSPVIINIGSQLERVLIWLTARDVSVNEFHLVKPNNNWERIGFSIKGMPSPAFNYKIPYRNEQGIRSLNYEFVKHLCQQEKCIFLGQQQENGLNKFFCQKFSPEAVEILERFQETEMPYPFHELFPRLGRFCCCPDT